MKESCPLATQDLKVNTNNRDSAIAEKHIQYGPLNLNDEDYWERYAKKWNTTPDVAKKSNCSNCVAFDISPRMDDCMPLELDEDGRLGYCWMHHFKCHSARTCYTWAKGGPITNDKRSMKNQARAFPIPNPKRTPKGKKIPKKYLKGLNREEMIIAAKEIDKGYKYDLDDPEAYEEWKSDIKAKARGYKTVPSKYKKKFVEMYGPLPEKGDFLTKISKATGIKKSILKEVEKKGLAAWRIGHRVGASQHAWAKGRVYSFVTLGNTVMKGKKKMGDYQLAIEAGLIKANPPTDYEEDMGSGYTPEEAMEYAFAVANDPELLDTIREIATDQNKTRYLKIKYEGDVVELLIETTPARSNEMLVAVIEPGFDSKWQKTLANPPDLPDYAYDDVYDELGATLEEGSKKKQKSQKPTWSAEYPLGLKPGESLRDRLKGITGGKKRSKSKKKKESNISSRIDPNKSNPPNFTFTKQTRFHKRCQDCKRDGYQMKGTKCSSCGGYYEYFTDPSVPFEAGRLLPNPPATMQTGIQKTGPTKHHGKLWKGEFSELPAEAKKWKKSTFKSGETEYEWWAGKLREDNTPYIATLKVDGEGVMAHFDGKETVVWNWYDRWRSNFHITDEITAMLKAKKIESAKLMGELYAVDAEGKMLPLTGGAKDELGMSDSTASIIKTTGDKSTMERQNRIRLAVFDILELNGKSLKDTPYEERIAIASGLVGGGKTVRAIPMTQGKGDSPLQKLWHRGLLEQFFEGLVIRISETGKTFKVKGAATVDLAVIGYYRGGRAEFMDEEGKLIRAGHAGSLENAVGGLALAFMDKDGNYIYSGNVGSGWKVQERFDLIDELKPHNTTASPPIKWGDHYADPSMGTHDGRGRGVMFPVKPTKILEAQYRGLNWGDRPVYEFKNGKYTQVGTTRAPALFQPSYKRWRDDKEFTPQDLRITQVPPEGEGKWKSNPNEFTLKTDFTLPDGLVEEIKTNGQEPPDADLDVDENSVELLIDATLNPFFPGEAVKKYPWLRYADLIDRNPQTRLDGGEPFRDEIDEKQDYRQNLIDRGYEFFTNSEMPKDSLAYYPKGVIKKLIMSMGAVSAKTNNPDQYFLPPGSLVQIQEWKRNNVWNKKTNQLEPRETGQGDLYSWKANPIVKMPMVERAEAKVSHIYRIMGNVFAAQLYNTAMNAKADRENYKRVCINNLTRLGKAKANEIDVTTVERTNICHLKGKKLPETYPGTGSPYIKRSADQTRSSDEPETITWECELSGKTSTLNNNPRSKILITVPHAAEAPSGPNQHETDIAAMPLANAISGQLKAEGKNSQVIVGEINRAFMDLNREEAENSDFHQKIDNALPNTDILLDIHSYPTWHPDWGEAQVVLFTSPTYPKEVKQNTMMLANHLGSSGIKVLIDLADHRNYIQTKGASAGVKQSELIEVREDQDLLPVAEAIIEYICDKPKRNPPEGSVVHSLVLRFDLPRILPFVMLFDRLEEQGFKIKSWEDKVVGGGGYLSMYLGEAIEPRKSKVDKKGRNISELVSIRFQENSKMVLMSGAKHLDEKEQKAIIDLVVDSVNGVKSNPPPSKTPTKKSSYKPKTLSTNVSRLVMGDLLPQINTKKQSDKQDKQSKPQEKKTNYFQIVKAFAKAEGKEQSEIVEEAKKIGNIDSKEKATEFAEALGLDMSKLKLNPPIFPIPQRTTGTKGYYKGPNGADVTGRHYKPATVKAQEKQIIVEWADEEAKPEDKSSGKRIRFNMLRPTKYRSSTIPIRWLVSIEVGGEHYYILEDVKVHTTLTMARKKGKSEPRLRPETYGEVTLHDPVGEIVIKSSKKTHKLYRKAEVKRQFGRFNVTNIKYSTPPPPGLETDYNIRQNPLPSNVKPTAKMFAQALGIPAKGMKTDDYHVIKSKVDRRMIRRNQEYCFDWELEIQPQKKLTKAKIKRLFPFLSRKEEVPSPKRIPYMIQGSREFYADKLPSGVVIIKGTGVANRILENPLNAHAKEYLSDHKPMTPKQISKIFQSEPLEGSVGSQKFLLQLSSKCQNYGEACGYAKDGVLYFKKGHPHLNEARVDGRMMADADAFFHTHPAAWEPSQTSPEDFIVYHGMFTNLGIQDHFTVIADRIDWFHFPKEERFEAEEMAEVSEEFEKDIMTVFNAAEKEFQEKQGGEPVKIVEQTRHINKTLCKAIPEYYAEYKCFELSPIMIMNSKVKKNPPLETYPLNTPYLEDIRPELYEEARKRFTLANRFIPWGVRYVDRNDPRIQSKKKSKNSIKTMIPVKDPKPVGKRFGKQGDELDILRSFGATDAFIKSARKYLTGFSGRTSNAHIFLALTLYKEISDAHNVEDGMTNALSQFIPSGGTGLNMIWMDDQSLEDIISLIESESSIEDAVSNHGKHAMALALHQMVDSILFSVVDSAHDRVFSRWYETIHSND
tara:strand:- start:834 stop:8039 length:7206 start_codon:yes stop_codon:yes gene_type:complete